MAGLAAPFAAAAALLVLAGLPKVGRPATTSLALRALRLPSAPLLVRLGGLAEAALGVLALVRGGRLAAGLVGLSYLGFTVFTARALRAGPALSSCGCFGAGSSEPSRLHVAVTAVLAVVAAASAAAPSGGLLRTASATPLVGIPLITLAALLTAGLWLALTVLPALAVAARAAPAGGPRPFGTVRAR